MACDDRGHGAVPPEAGSDVQVAERDIQGEEFGGNKKMPEF